MGISDVAASPQEKRRGAFAVYLLLYALVGSHLVAVFPSVIFVQRNYTQSVVGEVSL